MATLHQLKELSVTDTPLLLFDCELPNGDVLRWATHRVTFGGHPYSARILNQQMFEIRGGGTEGIDALSKLSLVLANADTEMSQVERQTGWKGSRLLVRFAFFNLRTGQATSEASSLFRGVCGSPDEVTEEFLRLTFTSRMNLQRVMLPTMRIQKRCPWQFPSSAEERLEATGEGTDAEYRLFARCGYSADLAGGLGNLNQGAPFTTCSYTKADCQQRGMYSKDAEGRTTSRFGGVSYLPPTIQVKGFGESASQLAYSLENQARYNEFVPLVYGTAWYRPIVSFSRNDGNLHHMEVILAQGEIAGVLKVLVNGVEIPAGQEGADMTATGWYNVVSFGGDTGAFNLGFSSNPESEGEPHGGMAVLSVVVPNRITSSATPRVETLVRGLLLPVYNGAGQQTGREWTNNPAWVLLDVLRRCGWRLAELNVASFFSAASYAGETIVANDGEGQAIVTPRFGCNLVLRKRRTAADIIRGIRNNARLILRYDSEGRLEVVPERSVAEQHPQAPAGSNSSEPLRGGWPAYEFGDGTSGFSAILRRGDGSPSLRLWSRSPGDSPNRYSVEFQDEYNEYQQDSVSLVDFEDVNRTGQETSTSLPALGIPNVPQATRLLRFFLDKAIAGNTYVEFETSVRGVSLRPGDIISLTYLKEGFVRQTFRVLQLSPSRNYESVKVVAQIHQDEWYQDSAQLVHGGNGIGRIPGGSGGIPRPLLGDELDPDTGLARMSVKDQSVVERDENELRVLDVGYAVPRRPGRTSLRAPIVHLLADLFAGGGQLSGGRSYYYAVSGVDGSGEESPLSFVVQAAIPAGPNTNRVGLKGLRFPAGTQSFTVYRGESPLQLHRIAENLPLNPQFMDTGLPPVAVAPPDEYFDHANIYWRFELGPELPVASHGPDFVEWTGLSLETGRFEGMVVRITSGRGSGQERKILTRSENRLLVDKPWGMEPDLSSKLVICEPGWRFGARSASSPVRFEVPNRAGVTVHILGRSANVLGHESAIELAPLRRFQLGGEGFGGNDRDIPGRPSFILEPKGGGEVEVHSINFDELENTSTIASGTLTLRYWNELSASAAPGLAAPVDSESATITMSGPQGWNEGDLIQIGGELLRVEGGTGPVYSVSRGVYSTLPAAHPAATRVYPLSSRSVVMHFPRQFFGSPLSGTYSFRFSAPNMRIAAADLFVTNRFGHSETKRTSFTGTQSFGLRTLSGGQHSLQVPGYLTLQNDATPPLVTERDHSVREVFAVLGEAPVGGPVRLRVKADGQLWCELLIPEGQTASESQDGFGLPALPIGTEMNVDIVTIPQSGSSKPGKDLTVVIRL